MMLKSDGNDTLCTHYMVCMLSRVCRMSMVHMVGRVLWIRRMCTASTALFALLILTNPPAQRDNIELLYDFR
jgi:hypothetical protein